MLDRKKRTSKKLSELMGQVRSVDTTPELRFRTAIAKLRRRYTVNHSSLIGKPDVVFPSKNIALFIDGDFWHGGQWKKRRLTALEDQFNNAKNKSYWVAKIRGNMARDCRNTTELLSQGFTVIRFWESEIQSDLEKCVDITLDALRDKETTVTSSTSRSFLPSRTFAEFFAGIGLMRMGLERAGWTIRFANDIDPQKLRMYRGNFSDVDDHFVLGDIHKLHADCIPDLTLATASFPCNDLSLAGSRAGLKGIHSSAFWGFIALLENMRNRRPPIVLIENVVGFLTSHQGSDLQNALLALNDLGYAVDALILDAARFTPQSRQRLFVVGILEELFPRSTEQTRSFYQSDVRPKALADFIFGNPQINWRIRDLPAQPNHAVSVSDILEDIPEQSDAWWSDKRTEYLLNQMSGKHREIADKLIQQRQWSYGTVFRRVRAGKSMAELRTDGIAGCLRTPRGGSGRQILLKAGYGSYFARLLSSRECARLMGADDYVINVPLNQALFGFGDAVCVPVIKWVAEYYLNPLVNELIHGMALRLNTRTAKYTAAHTSKTKAVA